MAAFATPRSHAGRPSHSIIQLPIAITGGYLVILVCVALKNHGFDFHNQMPKLRMAPSMAQAVVVSWCRTSDAMDQRLPYSTAPITGSYRVAVTMKWLSSAK